MKSSTGASNRGMNIALIAHDHMKDAIVAIVREFKPALEAHALMATGTTGGRLRDEVGMNVECLLSGPLGGDLQIGARLDMGQVDTVSARCSLGRIAAACGSRASKGHGGGFGSSLCENALIA